jgi:hypothetical protein
VETPGIIQPRQDFSLVLFKAYESWEVDWEARWGKRKAISLSIGAYTLQKGKDDRQVNAATDGIDKTLVTDDEDAIDKMLVTDNEDEVEDAKEGAVKDAVKDAISVESPRDVNNAPAPDVRNTYIKYLTKHCETNLPPCLAIKSDDPWRANPKANCGPVVKAAYAEVAAAKIVSDKAKADLAATKAATKAAKKAATKGQKSTTQKRSPKRTAADINADKRRRESGSASKSSAQKNPSKKPETTIKPATLPPSAATAKPTTAKPVTVKPVTGK